NQGHCRSDCSERKNQNHENQTRGAGAHGAVHALREGETDQDPNNIKDNIVDFWVYPSLTLHRWFIVLFYENFVSTKFWANTLYIGEFPSDGSLVGLQNLQ
ncbi:hypothetical protein Tco_0220976, partial [Tanacetum coccineum]